MAGRALVLGGGGVTGVAWEIGLLAGLADAGLDLSRADLVVGTSAGSAVAALITGGFELDDIYQGQLAVNHNEIAAKLGVTTLARIGLAALTSRDEQRARARIGAMAVAAQTVPAEERRQAIAARIRITEWPARRLLITAVAADDGEFAVFDRDSGVSIVDAVGASCAVPGVWPPVRIKGRAYIDGGMRSPANVDLAAGSDSVVVIAPVAASIRRNQSATAQVAALPAGTRAVVVSPDQAARTAIGRNVLDPARRAPAAQAGRRQASDVLDRIAAVWT